MIEILQKSFLFAKESRNPKVANIAFNPGNRDTRFQIQPYIPRL
jgi:hypothetical protein